MNMADMTIEELYERQDELVAALAAVARARSLPVAVNIAALALDDTA